MSALRRFSGRGVATPAGTMDAQVREAEAIVLHRIDEAGAVPRPTSVGALYSEEEYRAKSDEQEALWPAQGEREARRHQVEARGRDVPADATLFLLEESAKAVTSAHEDHQHARRVLTPYVRREPAAKIRYWVGWIILVLGDASGVLSAAITLGDIPWVAAGQALSAGFAGASAGLVGAELKHRQLTRSRQRDPDTLSDDERRYQRLFTGADGGFGVVKLVGFLSLTVVFLLAVAVGSLRTATEGNASGVTFALLAAATAIGSGLLGYAAADEVADLLATYAKRVTHVERHHRKLARATAIRVRAENDAAERSIQVEHALMGQAAARQVEAQSFGILRRNPGVAGHGYPTGEQSGVIGRRIRRGGAA